MTTRRTPGRPASGDTADRRSAILDVARAHFAAKGFRGASMRAIAREAGVDVSLISHYFGDKSRLLVATMELPVDPVDKIRSVIADGPDGMAERLLRTFIESWDPHHEVFSALVRTALGSDDAHAPMLEVARNVLVASLLEVLVGEERELRASLIASQLIGMATLRYVVRLEPLASADPADVVRQYAPPMQLLIG
ncbi:TetR family transcriptional regulator [Aeromicrobium sp.]|uniref:TetR/AcrR family transcriptional regulator n=1 Tax=Aeromicrobium sp. TaxID=1871063 RepID=UPI001986323E|nr:TetR family transcriptional regulator [Aeromicrobium sp.]MBC7633057.1 TetR/AcrR family transcriptional regulator [Aeromicrobium sp.]